MTNSLKSHIETLQEMFALAANERRMKEADALAAAIESLSRQGGEAVAELIHSADALTRMVVLPEGMQLGYGTHKLYASPTRASEAGDWALVPREPTAEMIRAGRVGDPLGCDVDDEDVTAVYTGSYRAMVAAALGKGEGS